MNHNELMAKLEKAGSQRRPHRCVAIHQVGWGVDESRKVMIVLEEPIGTIYRYDLIVPLTCSLEYELRLIAAAFTDLANDVLSGNHRTKYHEGADFEWRGNPGVKR